MHKQICENKSLKNSKNSEHTSHYKQTKHTIYKQIHTIYKQIKQTIYKQTKHTIYKQTKQTIYKCEIITNYVQKIKINPCCNYKILYKIIFPNSIKTINFINNNIKYLTLPTNVNYCTHNKYNKTNLIGLHTIDLFRSYYKYSNYKYSNMFLLRSYYKYSNMFLLEQLCVIALQNSYTNDLATKRQMLLVKCTKNVTFLLVPKNYYTLLILKNIYNLMIDINVSMNNYAMKQFTYPYPLNNNHSLTINLNYNSFIGYNNLTINIKFKNIYRLYINNMTDYKIINLCNLKYICKLKMDNLSGCLITNFIGIKFLFTYTYVDINTQFFKYIEHVLIKNIYATE